MERAQLGLTAVLRQRACDNFGLESLEPSALAQVIAERAALPLEVAEALTWGENPELDLDAIDRIGEAFVLHRDILSLLLTPTSEEMTWHVLRDVAADKLNTEECLTCCELEERVCDCDQLSDEALTELTLDMLEHIARATDPAPFMEDEEDETTSLLLDALVSNFLNLDRAAQQRVLAFACQEAAGVEVDKEANLIKAYAKLRQQLFSPLTIDVFDQLAIADGEITSAELVRRLGLRDGRSLSQLRRHVNAAVAELHDGLALTEMPLVIKRRGRQKVYSLTDEARKAWLNLMRADNSPLLITRDPVA